MRILHVNKFLYRRGGAEGYMLDVADRQRELGHDVRVWGMDHPENDAPGMIGPRPSYVEFEPAPPGAKDRAALAARMIWSRESKTALGRAVATWRPDVIHCHNIYHQLSPSVLSVAKAEGIPVVLTMHDYKLACPTYQFLDHGRPCTACVDGGPLQAAKRACNGSRAGSSVAAVEVWLHRRFGAYDPVGRFLAPSRFLADQIARAGVYPDRIEHLDNLTDVGAVEVASGPGAGAVFAGRLAYEKGVDTLIRAVAASGLDAGEAPVLEIAGDGPDRAELERLAQEVAPGRVRFHGRLPKDRLLRLVRDAAVSVVPSRWHENQPLSVLESYSAGVPVIATTLGGLPELVEPGATGWLVPAEDPRALGEALAEAVGDPERAHRMGLRGREVAERRFSPEVHLDRLFAHYEAVGAAR